MNFEQTDNVPSMADGYIRDMIGARSEIEVLRQRVKSQTVLIAKLTAELEQCRPEPVTMQSQQWESKAIRTRDQKIDALSAQIHILESKLAGKREDRKAAPQGSSEMRVLRAWYPETFSAV
jgi:hypothetical protein